MQSGKFAQSIYNKSLLDGDSDGGDHQLVSLKDVKKKSRPLQTPPIYAKTARRR